MSEVVKNSDRPLTNVTIVELVAFTRIRKDNIKIKMSEALLNNKEAWKYHKGFFPTRELVLKNKQYIKDYVVARDNHQEVGLLNNNKIPLDPYGWVVDVHISDKFSDNPRWYCSLILTVAVPKDKEAELLFKYGQSSLYAMNCSLGYDPTVAYYMENGKEIGYVVDIQFKEISFTMDPAYYNCRTLMIFGNEKKTKEELSDPNFIEKKKYKVYLPGKILNSMSNTTTTVPIQQQVPVTTPLQTTQQLVGQSNNIVGQSTTTLQNATTTPPQTIVKQQTTVQQKNQQQIQQERFKILEERFGLNFSQLKNTKDPNALIDIIEKKLMPTLCNYVNQEKQEEDAFIGRRKKDMNKHGDNYAYGREISQENKENFFKMLFMRDFEEPVNYLLKLQTNHVEKLKKTSIANTQVSNSAITQQQPIIQTPQSNQQSVPIVTGNEPNNSQIPTNQQVHILQDSVEVFSTRPIPKFGSREWMSKWAKSGEGSRRTYYNKN